MSRPSEPWRDSADDEDEEVIPARVAADHMFRAKYLYLAARARELTYQKLTEASMAMNDLLFEHQRTMVLPFFLLMSGVGVSAARLVSLIDGADGMTPMADLATLFLQAACTLTGSALFLWRRRHHSREVEENSAQYKRLVDRQMRHLHRLIRVRDAFERRVAAQEHS
jgi:hypothetical protein